MLAKKEEQRTKTRIYEQNIKIETSLFKTGFVIYIIVIHFLLDMEKNTELSRRNTEIS